MTDYSTWTLQRLFNKVYKHLINQNAKAMKGARCTCYDKNTQYRCAWGCLIPLKYYRNEEYIDIGDVMDKTNLMYDNVKQRLMGAFRNCHDNHSPENWPNTLKYIAKEFNLTIPGAK